MRFSILIYETLTSEWKWHGDCLHTACIVEWIFMQINVMTLNHTHITHSVITMLLTQYRAYWFTDGAAAALADKLWQQ